MGSMTFTRETGGNPDLAKQFSFDSSAELAISRDRGLDIKSVELRETGQDDHYINFEVHGRKLRGEDQSSEPLRLVGHLRQEKSSSRLATMR